VTRKPLIGEVDIKDLLARLAFAQEETQEAALEQAKLYMTAATYRVKRMKDRQEAEAAHDDMRTDLSVHYRRKYAVSGKKGVTEKTLVELVDRNSGVREARNAVLVAKRREEWSKLLLDAYEHRRSTIKILTQFAYLEDEYRPGGEEIDKMKARRERLRKDALKDRPEEDL
jgi:hypothetical protein